MYIRAIASGYTQKKLLKIAKKNLSFYKRNSITPFGNIFLKKKAKKTLF